MTSSPVFTKTFGDRFARERISLESAMAFGGVSWENGSLPRISQSLNFRPQFAIKTSSSHDGTLLFSIELMQHALRHLLSRVSMNDGTHSALPGGDMHMTIGMIRRATVFGIVNLKCGMRPGLRESITIPLRFDPVEGHLGESDE